MTKRCVLPWCGVLSVLGLMFAGGCSPPSEPTHSLVEAVETTFSSGYSGSDVYVAGEQSVSACANIDLGFHPSSEACYYWHRLKVGGSNACPQGRCDKLVIYFSGGDQACSLSGAFTNETLFYGKLAKQYVDQGYLFVCANLFANVFTPAAASMAYTYEAPRVAKLVNTILNDPEIQQHWSRKDLLFSGISHGATAPVLAMARLHVDRDTTWRGTRKTAACFLDGQYDVFFNQAFWTSPANSSSCWWFHSRTVCNRYLGSGVCSWTSNLPGMDLDSIVAADPTLPPTQAQRFWKSVTAADFALTRWKLVECGSAISASGGTLGQACDDLGPADMLPAPPISALCNTLNAPGSGKICDPGYEPTKSHVDCGLTGVADLQCRPWFDELPATQ